MSRLRLLFGISVLWLPLSMLADGMNALVLPHDLLRFTSEGSEATMLGLFTFAGLLLAMLIQPLAGALSDRFRWRRGRRITVGLGVTVTLAALAVYGSSGNLPAIVAGYLLVQSAASVAQAGQQGYIPDLVPPPSRGMASGLKGFMDIGGAMIGFVVLGLLIDDGQRGLALSVLGGALLIAFLLTSVLVHEHRSDVAVTSHVSLRDAFRVDREQHHVFVRLVAARFLFLLGIYGVGRFWLFFVADRLGIDPDNAAAEAGALLAVLALTTVVAALPAGWAADRFGRLPLMLAGIMLSALGMLALIVANGSLQIALAGGAMAVGSAAFTGANWALTSDVVPRAEAARFFGLANIGTAGAAAIAGLFGPIIDGANQLAPGSGFAVLLLISALSVMASALTLRGMLPLLNSPSTALKGTE